MPTEQPPRATGAEVPAQRTPAETAPGPAPIGSAAQFRRIAVAICLAGVAVQLLLTAYYLGMGHAAHPRGLPVGLVATSQDRAAVLDLLRRDGSFAVTEYTTADALVAATRQRKVYGGVDVTGDAPMLYVATAAGPPAATAMRTAYTEVIRQRTAARVAEYTSSGTSAAPEELAALTTPPAVTDVAPLPADDRNGASLGFLVQALALGGSIASIGLGRLIPRTARSWRRGVGHVGILAGYALGSAAVVLWSMGWFGVGAGSDRWDLLWSFGLVSLAITGSTAGAVALIGPAGAALGFLYFTLGTVISGASIPPEFLPAAGRHAGGWLPTGAGAQAVRDTLYFPDAPVGHPLGVLALYAVAGCLAVLVTNAVPNRTALTSLRRVGRPPAEGSTL